MITGGDADGREVLPVEVFAHLNRINAIFFLISGKRRKMLLGRKETQDEKDPFVFSLMIMMISPRFSCAFESNFNAIFSPSPWPL